MACPNVDRWQRWREPARRAGSTEMVARVAAGGVTDRRLLAAMAALPREAFVEEGQRPEAYSDRALPIGHGQTISQPLMAALLVQALELQPGDHALDIGTGSGYQAALMAGCGATVITIERIPELADRACRRLQALGIEVEVVSGDGSLGHPPGAPYQAIAVGAGAPRPPPALLAQLAPHGRLVVPVAVAGGGEELVRVRLDGDGGAHSDHLGPCLFVPLIGAQGHPEPAGPGDAAGTR